MRIKDPVEEKVAWAESYYWRFKERFSMDKGVLDHLGRLRNAIEASRREMERLGISDICSECEKSEGGSCCGAGVENRYDSRLLLINLLLNRGLPKTRYDEKSCFFLGEAGCLLYARHVICINYLCKKITTRIDPQEIRVLREKEGRELESLFLLYEGVKRVLAMAFPRQS